MTLNSEKSLSDNYIWHFEVSSLIFLLLNYHNLSQKWICNEACCFDEANNHDLFVYLKSFLLKQYTSQTNPYLFQEQISWVLYNMLS